MKRRDFMKAPVLGVLIPGATGLEKVYPYFRPDDELQAPVREEAKFQQRLHQDFSTYQPGMEYFTLGNGDIIAAIQYCPDRSAERPPTFVGLTLMDAERFGRKWSTFLFHPENGFARTALSVLMGGKGYAANPESLASIRWKYIEKVPVVSMVWTAGACEVEEEFFVPSEGQLLFRRVTLHNTGNDPVEAKLGLMLVPNFALFDDIHSDEKNRVVNARGFAAMNLFCLDEGSSASGRYDLTVTTGRIQGGERRVARFAYALNGAERLFKKNTFDDIWKRTVHYWSSKDLLTTGDETLSHLYNVSRTGLRALTARSGKRDSGFWMYNMEWVRDDVMMTLGMLHAGFHAEARTLLTKIIEKSIGPDGRTIESSRWFGYDYTEIDQNGQLLYGVWAYLCWSGDKAFVKKYWNKIRAAGDFPLQDVFRDKTARLLRNKREFWERNDSFGFEDGFELAYQFWVCMGLEKGAEVAARLGDVATATRWSGAAAELRHVMLSDPKFKLIEEDHLIKRRTRDGRWQRYAVPPNRKAMPPGSPAAVEEKPECEPDSADVYPIVFEMVDPKGDVAKNTLAWLEQLWSQRWDFGGYSRYNTFSEPDPPAPWPIASLLMARAYTEAGNSEKIWRSLRWLASIHGGKSGAWFERYGPSITPPAPPVCVVGWTWSEVVMLVVHHMFGLRPELDRLTIRPRLIEGLDRLKGKFAVRGGDIELAVYRTKEKPFAIVDGKKQSLEAGALSLPYGKAGKGVTVEMHVG